MTRRLIVLLALLLLIPTTLLAQDRRGFPEDVAGIPVNYDEEAVGAYTLPDPLLSMDGTPVRDATTWHEKRRPEIVRLYEENQFGRSPEDVTGLPVDVFEEAAPALDGKAIRRQVTIHLTPDGSGPSVDVLIYLPPGASEPVPLLLTASFRPNYSRLNDPGIKRGMVWNRERERVPASPPPENASLNPLPFLDKGFGVATLYYGDIEPDFAEGFPHGIRKYYTDAAGQDTLASDEWGAIAAWSWGLSRVMDYLETDADIDAGRVALMGISRLGKTVLWTGARDPRFAMIIASCSGEGGAALSKRNYGETIAHLAAPTRFPYQFAGKYGYYGDRVDEFPIDAHMLVSLIAPRPLLLQTGTEDGWSDPRGEFLSAVAAEPVFELLGARGPGTDQMPAAGEPILHTLGYYMHEGGHGTIASDWDVFLRFMEMHLE